MRTLLSRFISTVVISCDGEADGGDVASPVLGVHRAHASLLRYTTGTRENRRCARIFVDMLIFTSREQASLFSVFF
jgi:hypothetical protein